MLVASNEVPPGPGKQAMTITSTRDERLHDLHPPVGQTGAAGFFDTGRAHERASRWVAAIYFIIALATPFLMYAGPQVLSPAAPVIADHAVDGTFVYPPHVAHHG
jgi:hypothetical protein